MLAVASRAALGRWQLGDLVVVAVGVVAAGVVEWVVHLHLFHAPPGSFRARRLGTGRAHRRHHADPDHLQWLRLRPGAAAVMLVGVALGVIAWSVPIALAAGSGLAPTWVTAVVVGWTAVLHYEWTHLLIHSRHRLASRYYRRLARNHQTHHHRHPSRWFGVTSELGDRLFATTTRSSSGRLP